MLSAPDSKNAMSKSNELASDQEMLRQARIEANSLDLDIVFLESGA